MDKTDTARLDYLLAVLDKMVPEAEKAGKSLARADVDRVMSIWPKAEQLIKALIPPGKQ